MNKLYIAWVKTNDFDNLFKYGYTHLDESLAREVSLGTEYYDVAVRLQEHIPVFEYPMSYVMLLIRKDGGESLNPVKIEEVEEVTPLDNECRKFLSSQFDKRIVMGNVNVEAAVKEIQIHQMTSNSNFGAKALWKILKIKQPIEEIQDKIGWNALEENSKNIYENTSPSGVQSIYSYILGYRRHGLYPKETVGFFCDSLHIAYNFIYKKNMLYEELEVDPGMKRLMSVNRTEKYDKLLRDPIINEIQSKIDSKINSEINLGKVSFVELSSLFQIYRSLLCKEGLTKDGVDSLKKEQRLRDPLLFNMAVFMLGVSLGYSNCYSTYYDYIKPPIFYKYSPRILDSYQNNDSSWLRKSLDCNLKRKKGMKKQERIKEVVNIYNEKGIGVLVDEIGNILNPEESVGVLREIIKRTLRK